MFRFDGDGRTDRASLQDDVGMTRTKTGRRGDDGTDAGRRGTTFRFDGDGRTDRASLQDDVGGRTWDDLTGVDQWYSASTALFCNTHRYPSVPHCFRCSSLCCFPPTYS